MIIFEYYDIFVVKFQHRLQLFNLFLVLDSLYLKIELYQLSLLIFHQIRLF